MCMCGRVWLCVFFLFLRLQVLLSSSRDPEKKGIQKLWKCIRKHHEYLETSFKKPTAVSAQVLRRGEEHNLSDETQGGCGILVWRRQQAMSQLLEQIQVGFMHRLNRNEEMKGILARAMSEVKQGCIPRVAASDALDQLLNLSGASKGSGENK